MSFVIRQFFNEQTLGEKLQSLRKEARLTLSELATKTKIQKSYLKAFETNSFQKLPDPIYARNYLKTIIRIFEADETYFLDQFEQERGTCNVAKKMCLPRQRPRAHMLFATNRLIQILFFVVLVSALSFYIGHQIKMIIAPPELTIVSPADDSLTTDATIIVQGKTEKGAQLKINGENVLIAQDGTFTKEVALERGLNILQIEGSKRYSRLVKAYRRVIFDNGGVISIK